MSNKNWPLWEVFIRARNGMARALSSSASSTGNSGNCASHSIMVLIGPKRRMVVAKQATSGAMRSKVASSAPQSTPGSS